MFSLTVIFALALSAVAAPHVPRQSCADVTVFFARGTSEASPIGSIVGPPFRSALQSALSGRTINFSGVDYPASIAGFLEGGDPQGAATMANSVTSTASACPNTKIVMSGYRWGFLPYTRQLFVDNVFSLLCEPVKAPRSLTLLRNVCRVPS